MSTDTASPAPGTALLIGASRGLGHAMAAELVSRGWRVMGTVRGTARTALHDLADAAPGQVEIETLDMDMPDQLAALHTRLAGRAFDILFVNAGTTNDPTQLIGEVTTEEFIRVMTTNALSPMRVIEGLVDRVAPTGLIGAMSSGQGSVTNNTNGMREVYRGSKAALNMFMRSFAARQIQTGGAETGRPMLVMAPGWIRTDLGGPKAPFTMAETVPDLIDTLLAKRARPGLEYLDRMGATVPW